MHALSAAEPGSSALTALPTLGLLNRVHDYASAALGRNALPARRFRLFASTTRELSGLGSLGSFLGHRACPDSPVSHLNQHKRFHYTNNV